MSTCSNCYNGCTEIVSDRCIKYTGIDVPVLGIKTGDSLSFVEQALITFLTSTLDGTGVIIDLAPTVICELVNQYLPTCKDLSIVDISKALIEAACDLQEQVTANTNAINTLNADYTIGCLTGVTASSDTHAIVQAVITKLCTVDTGLTNLTTELHTMYSSNGTQLNNYIASYLASLPSTNVANARMVPYCPIPYYGPLSGYPTGADSLSLTGQGIGYWTKVYLCNGLNGTPDLRGRAIVGTTVMGNNAFPPQTDPCGSCTTCANPLYELGTIEGSNCVTLTTPQLPNHTHLNTAVATTPPHSHFIANPVTATDISPLTAINYVNYDYSANRTYTLQGSTTVASIGKTSDATQVITVTMTNAATGSGDGHDNIQPVIALHYIMYIP
jgi:microcystin-dependent protein